MRQRTHSTVAKTPGAASGSASRRGAIAGTVLTVVPPLVYDVLRSPGQSLDSTTLGHVESHFGHDFSRVPLRSRTIPERTSGLKIGPSGDTHEREADRFAQRVAGDQRPAAAVSEPSQGFRHVRVHTDAMAAKSARAIGAKAYTAGQDIVFSAGSYAPHTAEGRRLLLHELTHVVQQAGGSRRIQRFEAPVHESIELFALTTDASGKNAGFSLDEASATYFGNWMRDMNQLFVPLLVGIVDPEVIFAAANYMAQKKFGRTVTPEQFGHYIPAEHMDNPAGLVGQYDLLKRMPDITGSPHSSPLPSNLATRQKNPDPQKSTFAVDQSGVMAHIRDSNLHVERRLEAAVMNGRTADGLMHFGAALHAVEDLFAHSNWTEIAVSKLLAENRNLLPGVKGEDRKVFTYAPRSGGRPVLTTGSFTGDDTKVSIGSELVKMLRAPLAAPKSDAETSAEEKFTLAVLRALTTQLRTNKKFRDAIGGELKQLLRPLPFGLGDYLIEEILAAPLDKIYFVTTLLPEIPRAFKDALGITAFQQGVRKIVSAVILKPAADKIESEALKTQVSGTNLRNNLADNRRIAAGQWTPAELQKMKEKETLGGRSVATQKIEGQTEGAARADALTRTPEPVLAGPSHSQIAKDHTSSPFFRLAFQLATIADRMLRDKLLDAWAEKGSTAPYRPAERPKDKDEAKLAGIRHGKLEDSRTFGRAVAGADGPEAVKSALNPKAYDLAGMRHRSAHVLHQQASVLRLFSLQTLPDKLDADAALILGPQNRSPTLDEREAANAALVETRNAAASELTKLTLKSGVRAALKMALTGVIAVLDDEINSTSVAYTRKQRDVLEGKAHIDGVSQKTLSVMPISPPSLSGKPPKLQHLLEESRKIIGHPYDSTWWVAPVKAFIAQNATEVAAQIEARNKGYVLFDKAK